MKLFAVGNNSKLSSKFSGYGFGLEIFIDKA